MGAVEKVRDSDGHVIEIGDVLQMSGREDPPVVVDGFVLLPTYRTASGRSATIVRPQYWTKVGGDGGFKAEQDAILADATMSPCNYFGRYGLPKPCDGCPADGSGVRCSGVMTLDVLRRQRELDARGRL